MHTGKSFDYLGIDMDFGNDGEVNISMFKHIDAAIADFPEEIKGKAVTLSASHLFDIRENGVKLSSEKVQEWYVLCVSCISTHSTQAHKQTIGTEQDIF